MRSTLAAATISCMIGAVGFGGAFALAGSERAEWPCSERPNEPHCKTTPTATTTTVPGTTVTVTTPGSPPTTTTTPAQTVTVTTPAVTVTQPAVTITTPGAVTTVTKTKGKPTCAHGDWDINAPRCKPKLIVACKGKYRREILRWCLRYEKALARAKAKKKAGNVAGRESQQQPVTRGGGVTG